ncbi:glycerol-3-phosphate O-acyltransferase 2 [Cichlidogyrus casuarinus]|uniref:alanine transaminase n=1 Tax=Cichlidogyrus casuarinus TaxID=1844966 RepID=A0ABD2QPC6_9PLAT
MIKFISNARAIPTSFRCYTKLSLDTINPNVRKLEYAVRGPIVQRALEIEKELASGKSNKKFDSVIKCNIGDCHATGQKALTYLRQVLSIATDTSLFSHPKLPEDAKQQAKKFLDSCGGSVGVYSQSTGVESVRVNVSKYISNRDGIPADPKNIFLSTGASEAVKSMLQLISTTKDGKDRAGVMVPIPQYPLYSATNAEYNAFQINYYLDEESGWGLKVEELEKAFEDNKSECKPRALCVINPGNPTGQVLTSADIAGVIKFAHRNSLIIFADEVYQHNVYAPDREFVSFKKVLHSLGQPYANEVQLASFMSISKGYMGECGLRGGYCELVNFDPGVQAELYKCLSARLCPSLLGQLALDVVMSPPGPGQPSHISFESEKGAILDALKTKAKLMTETLNSLEGFSCQPIQGAMYAFPQMKLPKKAQDAAAAKGVPADVFYCFELLENTGICTVPGSGFGQKPGTSHLRITILPSIDQMKEVVSRWQAFHKDFMARYN